MEASHAEGCMVVEQQLWKTANAAGRMAQELGEKELLRMEVEQLRKEVKNPRTPISKTGKEIKDYVEAQAGNDPLLKGIPEDKNPFKEKGTCMIS
nr:guanine nucleotide-binding protein G(I)/G(S)/G(O) subunit gamma-T2 isoform X1 [Manis javanica]